MPPGSLVLLVTHTTTMEGHVTFATPGAASLAINVAIRATRNAAPLRREIPWRVDEDRRRHLTDAGLANLFDYFEEAMIAATFSFQSLEAFANQIIANCSQTHFTRQRESREETLTMAQLERNASTEEKLATILPTLCECASLKGKGVWSRFKELKAVRDSATHLKSFDHYRRGTLDRDSLYHRLLKNEVRVYPRTALEIMRHFSGAWGLAWIDEAERRLQTP